MHNLIFQTMLLVICLCCFFSFRRDSNQCFHLDLEDVSGCSGAVRLVHADTSTIDLSKIKPAALYHCWLCTVGSLHNAIYKDTIFLSLLFLGIWGYQNDLYLLIGRIISAIIFVDNVLLLFWESEVYIHLISIGSSFLDAHSQVSHNRLQEIWPAPLDRTGVTGPYVGSSVPLLGVRVIQPMEVQDPFDCQCLHIDKGICWFLFDFADFGPNHVHLWETEPVSSLSTIMAGHPIQGEDAKNTVWHYYQRQLSWERSPCCQFFLFSCFFYFFNCINTQSWHTTSLQGVDLWTD